MQCTEFLSVSIWPWYECVWQMRCFGLSSTSAAFWNTTPSSLLVNKKWFHNYVGYSPVWFTPQYTYYYSHACDWTRPLPPSIWNARHACPLMLTLHITMILHLHESEPMKSVRCACKHDVCYADLHSPLHVSRRSFWTLRGTWKFSVNLWILPNMGHMAALRREKCYVFKWAPNPALADPRDTRAFGTPQVPAR